MSDKVAGTGLGNIVLKDLKRPLEELLSHPEVRAINPGRSFRSVGKASGIRVTVYNPQTHSLKLSCHTSNGGQEVYVVIPQTAEDKVRLYIEELNRKYF